jgi:hypothetical protein
MTAITTDRAGALYARTAERLDQIDRQTAALLTGPVDESYKFYSHARYLARLEGERQVVGEAHRAIGWAVEGGDLTETQLLLTVLDATTISMSGDLAVEQAEGRSNGVRKFIRWFDTARAGEAA